MAKKSFPMEQDTVVRVLASLYREATKDIAKAQDELYAANRKLSALNSVAANLETMLAKELEKLGANIINQERIIKNARCGLPLQTTL